MGWSDRWSLYPSIGRETRIHKRLTRRVVPIEHQVGEPARLKIGLIAVFADRQVCNGNALISLRATAQRMILCLSGVS